MPGLPGELHNRCQNTLLQCGEFDSHGSLRAVFVTDELYPFRSDLPEAASKAERVAKCLDYLLEQRGTGSCPVLAIFLTALRDRYMPGNALRDDLATLAEEVEATLTTPSLAPAWQSPQATPTARAQTITWLHLSDFHFRASEQHTWNENIVLRALLEDVQVCIAKEGLVPDLILVSGDIAFSGVAAEYALARDFLEQLRAVTELPKERLFVVPGNHDVDRGLISRGAQAICDSLGDRDSTNAVLATLADRRLVFARFEGYAAFVNDYFGGHLSFDDEHYSYVRTLDLAGQRIAIMGLNSAWLCASDEDKTKGLLIGERQARAALDAAREVQPTLKIALSHHPFDWLREFDQNDSAALLLDNCHFILHGHLHQTAMTQLTSPDSSAMIIGGGASYKDRRYANRYSWVRLDLNAGTGTIYLRRYSDERGGFWAKDTLTYRNTPDGLYAFSLPSRLAASTGKPRPAARGTAGTSRAEYRKCIVEQAVADVADTTAAASDSPIFDLGAMRDRLNRTFDDVGLDAFCLDHFPELYDRFGRGMRKDEKITLLLDYCRRLPALHQRLVAALGG